MKAGRFGSRRQALLLGVLAVFFALAVVRWSGGGSKGSASSTSAGRGRSAASPDAETSPPAPRPSARRAPGSPVSPEDVPELSPEDLRSRGRRPVWTERDLFDLRDE